MRAGRDGKTSYIVQKEFKVFGVTKWKNICSFDDYISANRFYTQLSNV